MNRYTVQRDFSVGRVPARRLLIPHEQNPIFGEQVKTLRAKLEHRIDILKLRVIALTSAIAGEGKSMVAVNLAAAVAATGRTEVLLVDMDIRKADLSRRLGASEPGLCELVEGNAPLRSVVRGTDMEALDFLPAGRAVRDAAVILASEPFRDFLAKAREEYGVVLLDAAPILPVSDALAVKEHVDGFILLYRAGHTPYPMLRQAAEELGPGKILGVVLNAVESKKPKYYEHYYGKYYAKPRGGE